MPITLENKKTGINYFLNSEILHLKALMGGIKWMVI
jgi:hypothetical protein